MKNNLKELRNNCGMKQAEVAEALGVAIVTYRKYEQGAIHLTDEGLIRLSNLFDCSIDEILGAAAMPSSKGDAARHQDELRHYLSTFVMKMDECEIAVFQRLVESYAALSAKGRLALSDYADTLVRSGKYAELGRGQPRTFSDGDPGAARQRASA